MRTLLSYAHAFVDHPATNLIVAAILIATSVAEAGESILEPLVAGEIGAHHGMLVFGLTQFLRTLPEVIEGLERLFHRPKTEAD